MSVTTIDAKMLQKMFLAGAKNLEAKKEWINELNVFPVPDGDTGTNMTLTIMAAAKEVEALETVTFETLAKAISSGSLRGARGNSGVILSQLFRGFTKVIKTQEEELDTVLLSEALTRATETAYKAVMKPKEGTILTVAKGLSDKAAEIAETTPDLAEFMAEVLAYGDEVLARTPDMLPVLKQAGVVDSGGQGLMQALKGMMDALLGKEVDFSIEEGSGEEVPVKEGSRKDVSIKEVPIEEKTGADNRRTQKEKEDEIRIQRSEPSEIRFGYCTEFILMAERAFTLEDEQELKQYFSSIGDCVVVVSDEEIVKVHVHTNHPGQAIEKALTYGSLSKMKIDNMREEHQEKLIKDAESKAKEQSGQVQTQSLPQEADGAKARKAVGFIAVSVGEGLDEIFLGLGVDYLIPGGQTMNPSTEDMIEAIAQVNADTVFILPNNSNIILAAQQATYLVEDKKILIVPSKTVPQGIAAVIAYMADRTPEENLEVMTEDMEQVRTGQVTYAVRNTVIDDKEIKENDIMGIGDHSILSVGQDIETVTLEMIGAMVGELDAADLISIYYGADITLEVATGLAKKVRQDYPDCEVELQAGGQPIYYYIISVE